MSALQAVVTIVAGLGGLAGLGSFATVLAQRRKIRAEAAKVKADAADVLTDTALALVQPLRDRLSEFEAELDQARREAAGLAGIIRRWRVAILAPDADLVRLRSMVLAEPSRNGDE